MPTPALDGTLIWEAASPICLQLKTAYTDEYACIQNAQGGMKRLTYRQNNQLAFPGFSDDTLFAWNTPVMHTAIKSDSRNQQNH